jgi:hypothetical protein
VLEALTTEAYQRGTWPPRTLPRLGRRTRKIRHSWVHLGTGRSARKRTEIYPTEDRNRGTIQRGLETGVMPHLPEGIRERVLNPTGAIADAASPHPLPE